MPPIEINIQHDLDRLTQDLDDLGKKQIPFAASLAINNTAKLASAAVRAQMAQVFDRPKPFTLNSVYVAPSSKSNLEATVGLKSGQGGRQGAAEYLKAEVIGGPRALTPFEQHLAAFAHSASVGIPGGSAKLDAFGNLSRSVRAAIINAEKGGSGSDPKGIFVVPVGSSSHLKPGVYQRIPIKVKIKRRGGKAEITGGGGSRLKCLMLFEAKANYTPRLHFAQVVEQSVLGNFGKQFELAMIRARFSAYDDFSGGAR